MTDDRHGPMGDRIIRVSSFRSESEASEAIRKSYDPSFPVRRFPRHVTDAGGLSPADGSSPTSYVLPGSVGITAGTNLTVVSASSIVNEPDGTELSGLHIKGLYVPKHNVILRNCLIEGTDTESTVVNGVVTVANAPAYAMNCTANGVRAEAYHCEFRRGGKLLYLSAGAYLEDCAFYDAGEDCMYANYQSADVTVKRCTFDRMANLAWHHKAGTSKSSSHPDIMQLRGQAVGKKWRVENSYLNGAWPGQPGAAVGVTYGNTNRCLLAQTKTDEIHRVELVGNYIACGANYAVGLRNPNAGFGAVKNAEFTGNTFAKLYQSAGTIIDAGCDLLVSGNKMNGASVDEAIASGVWPR